MNGKDDLVHEMNPRKDRLREFFTRKTSVRELVAEQAADWFVANRAGLDATQSAAFAAWLRTSPLHIEEYLNISMIGRSLRAASDDPVLSFDDLMKRALASEDPVATALPPEPSQSPSRSRLTEWLHWRPQPWLPAAAAVAVLGVVVLGVLLWKRSAPIPADVNAVAYNIQTRHGELLTRQLPDNSILKLDTDTSVAVRFDSTQRLVRVFQGRAEFKVAHEPTRKFLVQAGTVGITDIGTEFAVYARPASTVVTVLEGRVAVAVDPKLAASLSAREGAAPASVYAPVEVAAGEQVRVDNGSWPPTYMSVDRQRVTAWMRGQIVFEKQPLEQVAADFNRYAATPIEIDSPALRTVAVSGVFAANDTESFVAFLRSLDGVQVEVTPTRIRVYRK